MGSLTLSPLSWFCLQGSASRFPRDTCMPITLPISIGGFQPPPELSSTTLPGHRDEGPSAARGHQWWGGIFSSGQCLGTLTSETCSKYPDAHCQETARPRGHSPSVGFQPSPVLHVTDKVWVQQEVSVHVQGVPESFLGPVPGVREGSLRTCSLTRPVGGQDGGMV